MCGRFYGADIAKDAVMELTGGQDLDEIWRNGDILPSERACVLLRGEAGSPPSAAAMRWGFLPFRGKNLLINARAETALEKPSFSDSVKKRRCVIPAAGFYEWDRDRRQYAFRLPEEPVLYMAGCFRSFGEEVRFTILTAAANESMREIHDRMPLILPSGEVQSWLSGDGRIEEFLKKGSPQLVRKKTGEEREEPSYEQLTLEDLF